MRALVMACGLLVTVLCGCQGRESALPDDGTTRPIASQSAIQPPPTMAEVLAGIGSDLDAWRWMLYRDNEWRGNSTPAKADAALAGASRIIGRTGTGGDARALSVDVLIHKATWNHASLDSVRLYLQADARNDPLRDLRSVGFLPMEREKWASMQRIVEEVFSESPIVSGVGYHSTYVIFLTYFDGRAWRVKTWGGPDLQGDEAIWKLTRFLNGPAGAEVSLRPRDWEGWPYFKE